MCPNFYYLFICFVVVVVVCCLLCLLCFELGWGVDGEVAGVMGRVLLLTLLFCCAFIVVHWGSGEWVG